jgi:thioredoxin 1
MHRLILTFGAIFLCFSSFAVEINFIDGSLATALKRAKSESKVIFIDFYATWCAPCIKMQEQVFTSSTVASYFNWNFINLKIDTDHQELDLVRKMQIGAVPALTFIDQDGKLIYMSLGFKNPEDLMALGKNVSNYYMNSGIDPNDLKGKDLVNFLEIHRFSHEEEANFLAAQTLKTFASIEYKTQDAWDLMRGYVTEMNHPAFQSYVHNANWFFDHFENASDLWEQVFSSEFKKIIEEENPEGIVSITKMEIQLYEVLGKKDFDDEFYLLENRGIYIKHTGNYDDYLNNLETLIGQYCNDNPDKLIDTSLELLDEEELQSTALALKFSTRAYSISKNVKVVAVYAISLGKNGMESKGKEILNRAIADGNYSEEEIEYLKEAFTLIGL